MDDRKIARDRADRPGPPERILGLTLLHFVLKSLRSWREK
jgi:hypothetical protein